MSDNYQRLLAGPPPISEHERQQRNNYLNSMGMPGGGLMGNEAQPSAFETGMIAGLRTELAAARAQLAEARQGVLMWSRNAAEWRERAEAGAQRIAELTAERDAANRSAFHAIVRAQGAEAESRRLKAENPLYRYHLGTDDYVLADATSPGPALVGKTRGAIMGTPRPDSETPRTSDAESAADLSGGKPNTGHPAGGRAMPARALRGGDGIPRL
jgi:hypothetical protein